MPAPMNLGRSDLTPKHIAAIRAALYVELQDPAYDGLTADAAYDLLHEPPAVPDPAPADFDPRPRIAREFGGIHGFPNRFKRDDFPALFEEARA